ncbi:MAG: potassium channel protein [Proteobacteria bacterium]|nr:potassium channel protein [Pseudomonadota bacterium]
MIGLFIFGAGTLGYSIIEGWSPLESFYMTLITVATIGYGEIKPLSPAGRIFTILIIVIGVGNMAYLVGQFSQSMVEGSLQRVFGRHKLEQIEKLKDHYILCGYGRIGRSIAKEITARKIPLVVVESDLLTIEQCEKDGMLYIRGDASDEDNLLTAGIKRALGVISVVSSDAENVYIVLTARGLNPDLFIVARATEEKSIKKMTGAGADRVVSPNLIGARKMAQAVLKPAVSDFIETTVHGVSGALAMEEVLVTPKSKIKDISLMESNIRRDLDLIVIAIKTAEGEMLFNPSAQARIREGDTLIAVGLRENMDRLAQILGADRMSSPRYFKRRT